jgi:AraC-like DNA-binding protein
MTEARTAIACKLLAETNRPLKAVAFLLGYSCQSSFTEWFQHANGELPSAFRDRKQCNPSLNALEAWAARRRSIFLPKQNPPNSEN